MKRITVAEVEGIIDNLVESYKKRNKPRHPQHGKEKVNDQKYYKKHKKEIRKQQKKYYRKNKHFLNKK